MKIKNNKVENLSHIISKQYIHYTETFANWTTQT